MDPLAARLQRYRDLVDDWQAFLDACRRPLPLVVWANPLRGAHARRVAGAAGAHRGAPAEALHCVLARRGLQVRPLGWLHGAYRVRGLERPGHTLEHFLGLMHVQEEVSLIPPAVLGARPGERVLDLCAAPGGKTARLAAAMGNRGTLVANDVRPQRLRALRANCERLGALNVVVTALDGTRFPLAAGPFDRILLDAPCSCEGNVRQSAGGGGRAPAAALVGRSGLQATLLGRAWKLLRPGGTLVYATCTFAPEENEIVLDGVLGEDAEIAPLPLAGLRWAPGVCAWQGRSLRPDCRNVARFWPHLNDTGGFTVALVRKRRDGHAGPTAAGAVTAAARAERGRGDRARRRAGARRSASMPAAAAVVPLGEGAAIAWWCETFATDPRVFSPYALYAGGRNRVWIAAAELDLHGLERVEAVGVAFARVGGRTPKPTTAAVQQFGLHAQARTVEVGDEGARAFLARAALAADAVAGTPGRGYAIVRWRGVPLGCGLWRDGRLESNVPAGRALDSVDLPPD